MGEIDKIEKKDFLIATLRFIQDEVDHNSIFDMYKELEDAVTEVTGEEDILKVRVLVWEFLRGI
jgi:hypothetical protein